MNISDLTLIEKRKSKYAQSFFIAFFVFLIIMIPLLIYNKGYLTFYGDFNAQQIPFYYHAHNAVRNGQFFWDWGTDLGANFIGSYSFYLLGSPFFWLTLPFPTDIVLYLMPILLALKYAFASLTAYAYIKRFILNDNIAIIAGLLYAFSGFQSYNIFFNHFHDVTAFFPLLLIALEENITNNKKGYFALIVAFMAILNYFFFTGQVVFIIIYFILRCFCKDFNVNLKKFLGLSLEAIIGVGLASIILIPSAFAILGNYRIDERLYGLDMVVYSDKTRILRIIQSFFMIPDSPARPNLFNVDSAKWSSIGGYFPLFSMVGVLSFIKYSPDHWISRIIKICIVCAFIPILNSSFYMFNSSYYARWYYMPILIMALATAHSLENKKTKWNYGFKISALMLIFFGLISIIPTQSEDKTQWFQLPKDLIYFYITLGICIISLITLFFVLKNKKNINFKLIKQITVVSCFLCTSIVFYYGIAIGPYPNEYLKPLIKEKDSISITQSSNEFFRIDISENYDNYPMVWGFSSMRTFHSIVPSSLMQFYDSVGIQRDVASRADTTEYALRGLFSVKYYFDKQKDKSENSEESVDSNAKKNLVSNLEGFEYLKTENGFDIYENQHYIPMGFTYDYYVNDKNYNSISKSSRSNMLVKAIYLNDEQILKYGDLLTSSDELESNNLTRDGYVEECKKRASNSCYSFTKNSYGFEAKINLEKENLVFFSVPYDKGFSATVNNQPVEIEEISGGFMAVKAPKGENIIEFSYVPYGFYAGLIIFFISIVIFSVYLVFYKIKQNKCKVN